MSASWRIVTATDLSRMEVDSWHRKEIEAARTEIARLNATLDVVTADRDAWRDDYLSAVAQVEAVEAERDELHDRWWALTTTAQDVPSAAPRPPLSHEQANG
jgi:hypothetical protein